MTRDPTLEALMSITTAYPSTRPRALATVVAASALLTLTACGGDASESDSSEAATEAAAPEAVETAAEAVVSASSEEEASAAVEEMAEDLADDLESAQDSMGGGSATFTAGDQTWTFDSVLCAIGEEQTGQDGAEFVLSSLQDGLQLYVSIDSFGHSVTLDDVDNFEDPSVSLQMRGEGEFIEVDGTEVRAEGPVTESDAFDTADAVDGTLEATCPG